MNIDKIIRNILKHQLQLGDIVDSFTNNTVLLGAFPELDSMGIVNIITALEEQVGFSIDDDEIDADVFATLGSLIEFVRLKV